ncbi:Transposon TX1 uncharacterized 149 kDa protein [Vitis vinifera]|uniref:Transposon TX1 uncharacterized 149 kDa protein n=1 Tax=Vitis vinifera TaxID=29760 RepID=A0A438DJ18_VITVI|nr:Transposon TX1 uncharacterized 149 kDa protein [Vitis vinifera]
MDIGSLTNCLAYQSVQVGTNTFSSKSYNKRGARGTNFEEEIHWRQKAKVKWVKDGDCNSKLFHKVANGRQNRNFIKFLENERGLVLDNSESITEEILLYFKKLYSSPLGESWRVEGIDWSPILEESASRLDSPFTEEEIFNTIFQLDRDKTSGLDGFTIAVFQDYWDVIKEDLVRVFTEASTRSTTRDHPLHSRCFCSRETNSGCILIANEIVDEKRRSGEKGVVFKIDFEKAYDHVKWDFLDHMLEKKGFSSKWRSSMRGCLSSVSYAILVNDVLSRMLLKAEERNLLEASGEEELHTLKSLLLVFGQISGLKVNLDKSNLFGINLDQNHLSRLALMLDCKASDWPILYLGLPLGRNPTACGFWDPVIEFQLQWLQKSRGCKGTFFGQGLGKAKEIILLAGMQCASRGLKGFGDWEDTFKESLWHQVILSIYGTHSNGDGERIRFWEDLWWGDQIFKDQYPRLYRVVMDKNSHISSILGSSRPFSWNFNFRRNLTDSKIEDLECLMHSLDCMNLSTSASDARSWSLLSSGLFTVKSFFIALSQMPDSSPFFPTKFVWKSQVPFKVKAFVWLMAHKKVNTNELLQLRRPHKALSPDISSQDGLGTSEKHFRHDVHQLQRIWQVQERGNSMANESIALIWVVWRERNAMIFEDKARNSGNL